MQNGKLKIKALAAVKVQSPQMAFDRGYILQQWSLGDDFRLQIEIADEAAHENVNLVILARRKRSQDKYLGTYVLKVTTGGELKKFTSPIRQCEAG